MANPETVALIEVITRHHVAKGRPRDCALLVWLQKQGDRPADDVRAEMVRRPEWEPTHTLEAMAITKSPSAQAIYARALADAPWQKGRGMIERVFEDDSITLTQAAVDILVAKLASAHPNPKAFLLKQGVRNRLGAGVSIDIGALRAPDFPAVNAMRGRLSRAGLSK